MESFAAPAPNLKAPNVQNWVSEHAIDLEAPHLLDEAQFPADALRWRERAKEK